MKIKRGTGKKRIKRGLSSISRDDILFSLHSDNRSNEKSGNVAEAMPLCLPYPKIEYTQVMEKCQAAIQNMKTSKLLIIDRVVNIDLGDIHLTTWMDLESFQAVCFVTDIVTLVVDGDLITPAKEYPELDEMNPFMTAFLPILQKKYGDSIAQLGKRVKICAQKSSESFLEYLLRFMHSDSYLKNSLDVDLFLDFTKCVSILALSRLMLQFLNDMNRQRMSMLFSMWAKMLFLKEIHELMPELDPIALKMCKWEGGPTREELAGFAVNPIAQILRRKNPSYFEDAFYSCYVLLEPYDKNAPKLQDTSFFDTYLKDQKMDILLSDRGHVLQQHLRILRKFIDSNRIADFTPKTDPCVKFLKSVVRTDMYFHEIFLIYGQQYSKEMKSHFTAFTLRNRLVCGLRKIVLDRFQL